MLERRYHLLGGLEVLDGAERLDLGTRKQRAVLATLLLEEGRVVTVNRLVEAVWDDDPPNRAEASLQSYISTLRRVLEPNRGPRATPTVLVTQANGYALRADRSDVDLWRFADLIHEGRQLHAAGDLDAAATKLRNALAMYAPLLPEFEDEPFTRHARVHLEGLHAAALELSYEVRLALGEHALLVADLEEAVQRYPLHEGLWALLATARYRVGRQSEALRAIADCRRVLSEETGVEPGPRLRQLEADLLAQAPSLDAPVRAAAGAVPVTTTGVTGSGSTSSDDGTPGWEVAPDTTPVPLIGRVAEAATLHRCVDEVVAGGRAVVLLEGEPGVGKTHLLEELVGYAASVGAAAFWGRCAEGDGAPTMWPWIQVANVILRQLDGDARDRLLAGDLGELLSPSSAGANPSTVLPDTMGRLRLFDHIGGLLADAAALGPLLILLDDLQWADAASLELFEHLAARTDGQVLLVGALREHAATDEGVLTRMLAAVSRVPRACRIKLGPLSLDEVGALVELETGSRPTAPVVESLLTRTEGNPFFVRQLARLIDHDGAIETSSLPAGVRDVVRGRMDVLPAATKDLLQIAALIGRDVELGLLARAADLDIEACLDRLDPAVALGVIVPAPDDPFSLRFSHDLVRESIVETTPPLRTTRLHLRVADALDGKRGDDDATAERLAHHLWSAGPLADPVRTAQVLIKAARAALRKYAYDAAQRDLEHALGLARQAGDDEVELDALVLLTTVIGVQVGYVGAAVEVIERAEQLARSLGNERLAADLLYARWAAFSQGIQLDKSGPLAVALREQGAASDDPVIRRYGDHAWGIDQWDRGNIGESLRSLQRSDELVQSVLREGGLNEHELLRFDLQLLSPAFLGHMIGLSGDVAKSREHFDRMERDLVDGPYALMVWGSFSCVTAALCNDPRWARRVGAPCIAADPDLTFSFLGINLRIEYWWAEAMLAEDEAELGGAIERMEEYIGLLLSHSARSGEHIFLTLLAEAQLRAKRLDEAAHSLDQAEASLARHGQRYAEPLTIITRARWLHRTGAAETAVRDHLEAARVLAVEREAFLFVPRADAAEAELFS